MKGAEGGSCENTSADSGEVAVKEELASLSAHGLCPLLLFCWQPLSKHLRLMLKMPHLFAWIIYFSCHEQVPVHKCMRKKHISTAVFRTPVIVFHS